MDKQNLINKIWEVKLNEKIDLKIIDLDYVRFEQVRIDSLNIELRGQYSWVAQKDGYWGIFPMKNGEYVKFFKTLAGAKRNFIKRYITNNGK